MNLRYIWHLHEIGGKKTQEDYLWPQEEKVTLQNRIFIVCDGVGGAENGELASKFIAEHVGIQLTSIPFKALSNRKINDVLKDAQEKLIAHVRQFNLNADMATTFTLVVLNGNKAFISWCGDSRVYHIRNEEILYRTSDHSLVNSLVLKGEITEEEAQVHPQKNYILKAVKADGSPIEAESHFIKKIKGSDYFMLCTDGLLENLKDQDIPGIVSKPFENDEEVIQRIQEKCYGKTRDNYSMYLIKVHASGKGNKMAWLLILLFIIIAAALAYFYIAREQKETENGIEIITPVYEDSEEEATPATEQPRTERNASEETNKNDPDIK
ncbi:MAG: serine/threonine-protein phosphatase [Chitinophagaceae bacterium]|nr:serine/threonine-protein phosphatase [Chitinophagaceae bacterium]